MVTNHHNFLLYQKLKSKLHDHLAPNQLLCFLTIRTNFE